MGLLVSVKKFFQTREKWLLTEGFWRKILLIGLRIRGPVDPAIFYACDRIATVLNKNIAKLAFWLVCAREEVSL